MTAKFTRNLISWFILSISLLIITSLAAYTSIENLLAGSKQVSHTNKIIRDLEMVISVLKDAETGQRGYLLTGSTVFLEPYTGSAEKALVYLHNVEHLTVDNPEQQQSAKQLDSLISNRLNILQTLIDLKKNGQNPNLSQLLLGKKYMDGARDLINIMEAREESLLKARAENVGRFTAFTPVLVILGAILSILITSFYFLKINADFKKRAALQLALQSRELETRNRINLIGEVAGQLSAGNFTIRAAEDTAGTDDELGSITVYLNKMAASLEHSFKLLHDNQWFQTGIARLNDAMIGEKNLEQLSGDIIVFLADYSHSLTGAIYILQKDQQLCLQNSFALRADATQAIFAWGEGLPGQAALLGREILTSNIDNGRFGVSSACGDIFPRSILTLPVIHEGLVIGVIELGSLTEYLPRELDFLKKSAENIGIAIYTAQNRKRLQELLEETQSQSEELHVQHSELELMNTELEINTSKLQASEEELRVQQEELLVTNQELEERSGLLEEKNQQILESSLEIQHKADELEQTNRYKSEFLANMSHELRTPLNSILLLSRLLADNHESNLTPGQIESARVIQSSGSGLLSLIDEILDLSKIEAGKMALEFSQSSFIEIKSDLEQLFDPVAKDKELDFSVNISPNLPSLLETDKLRLEQILRNLLSNALKFTLDGSVTLNISRAQKPGFVSFSVRDTGIGIAKEKHNVIFEAFQQADGSTSRKFGGTGLGLSISMQLCQLLQGTLEFESEPGKGSLFTLSVPLSPIIQDSMLSSGKNHLSEQNTTGTSLVKIRDQQHNLLARSIPEEIEDDRMVLVTGDRVILIVEDDINFARVLLRITREKGYKGIVCVRGDQAPDLALKFQPAAILLDVVLPVVDGWQVMEKLKNHPGTKNIPVHMMSSLEARTESLQKGAIDFIHKPLALDEVRNIFSRLDKVISNTGKKVLIVEENHRHARALSYFLETFQVSSVISSDPDESVTLLLQHEVDCVIFDNGKTQGDILDSICKIKKSALLEEIPVIVFTGKTLSKNEENKLRQVADSIVLKTAFSYQRILDEVSLFLHRVETKDLQIIPAAGQLNDDSYGRLPETLRNKNVLIADDDARNIFSIGRTLEVHEMNVYSALDGQEALDILEKTARIDVILMDMMMPNMDGYESIAEIRRMPRFKDLPILAITAKAMAEDREKCISAGASDYISKPVDIDQLVSLLRVWLY